LPGSKRKTGKDLFSYEEHLRFMRGLSCGSLSLQEADIIRRFQSEQYLSSRYAPVVYMLDYTTNKYIYVDEGCFDLFGYTAKQWVEEGIDGYLSKWHPSDYQVWNTKVFADNVQFLQSVPLERYRDLIFSSNYRVLNAKGDYITILQRSSYIPGEIKGKPKGTVGVAFDITHFKNDTSVIHTIEEVKEYNGRPFTEILFKKVHALTDEPTLRVSNRELEVLRWMAEGFSSKQIAASLNLSINTVNNHRKNMLCKTGSKSSAELLRYALKHGFLS
jgi:DNA-binding CsgD family transcriptional regulator